MSTYKYTLVLVLLIASLGAYSQGISGISGADAWSQGGISTTLNTPFSALNNAAVMSHSAGISAGLYSEQRFNRNELLLSSLAVVLPNKIIDAGIGVSYFGFNSFNQQRIVLSASKKIAETISIGVQGNYLMTNINEYGQSGVFVLGAGVYYQPTSKIEVGVSIFNPNQQKFSDKISDQIPAFARLGCSYKVNSKVRVLGETELQLNQPTIVRGGIQYHLQEKFGMALGASSNPGLFCFGMFAKYNRLVFDAAATTHPTLGFTPSFSIRLQPKK